MSLTCALPLASANEVRPLTPKFTVILPSVTPLMVGVVSVTDATAGVSWPFALNVKSVPMFCQAVAPPVAFGST